jgi:ADP-ribosyl-[dinitrogen reductase] hydrolase
MGSLIGDALGLGYHWYYDVKAMRREFGDWFRDYHDGKPDRDDQYGYIAKWRYEFGLRAGDLSQTGQIAVLLLGSFAEHSGYSESDFCVRLDQVFSELDGTACPVVTRTALCAIRGRIETPDQHRHC